MEEMLGKSKEVEQKEQRDRIAAILRLLVQEMSCDQEVGVRYTVGPQTTVYMIDMPPGSKARIIGQGGRNIVSIRNLVAAMGGARGFRAIVDLVV